MDRRALIFSLINAAAIAAVDGFSMKSKKDQAARLAAEAAQQAAEADKKAILEQYEAAESQGQRERLTKGFEDISFQYDWLLDSTSCVAALRKVDNTDFTFQSCGSALLLDKQGTVVFIGDQKGEDIMASFFPIAGWIARSRIVKRKDSGNVLQFGTINPDMIVKYPLLPVRWNDNAFTLPFDKKLIAVGYNADLLLHATELVVDQEDQQTDRPANSSDCATFAKGVTFLNMQGGGVFLDGKFTGLIYESSEVGAGAHSWIIPAGLIRNAYCELYPDRAAQAGIKVTDAPAPPACRIDLKKSVAIPGNRPAIWIAGRMLTPQNCRISIKHRRSCLPPVFATIDGWWQPAPES